MADAGRCLGQLLRWGQALEASYQFCAATGYVQPLMQLRCRYEADAPNLFARLPAMQIGASDAMGDHPRQADVSRGQLREQRQGQLPGDVKKSGSASKCFEHGSHMRRFTLCAQGHTWLLFVCSLQLHGPGRTRDLL